MIILRYHLTYHPGVFYTGTESGVLDIIKYTVFFFCTNSIRQLQDLIDPPISVHRKYSLRLKTLSSFSPVHWCLRLLPHYTGVRFLGTSMVSYLLCSLVRGGLRYAGVVTELKSETGGLDTVVFTDNKGRYSKRHQTMPSVSFILTEDALPTSY